MKRIILLLTALLLAILSAHAETWFPDVSGTFIHRDPFCIERLLTTENYLLPSRQYASRAVILEEGSYAICPHCDVPSMEIPAESELYYNPAGGTKLHHDPLCPGVAAKYLPLVSIVEAEIAIPQKPCSLCGPRFMLNPADERVWSSSIEERSLTLPGVWTLPSAGAITPEAATAIARDWAKRHLPERVCSFCMMHYDYGLEASDHRETYKILITTDHGEPLRLIRMDAITGEIYSITSPASQLDD